MDKIQFTDDLKLGIESIDNQHRKLVDLINFLIGLEAGNAQRHEIARALDELGDYIDVHFQAEEKMMQDAGYPDLEEHRELHAAFVMETTHFMEKFRGGDENLDVDILVYLSGWVVEHIKGEDPKYVGSCR